MNDAPEVTDVPASESSIAPAAPESPTFLYFKKIMSNMQFYVDRKPVQFEPLDRNFGVLKISTLDPLVPALLDSAKARRGGIVAIDEATYEDLKKNLPYKPLVPKFKPHVLQALRTEPPRKQGQNPPSGGGVAAAVKAAFSGRTGVGSVGGGGTGDGAGTPAPAPVPPPAAPDQFKPATGKKNVVMPVTKTSDRKRDLGEPDTSDD